MLSSPLRRSTPLLLLAAVGVALLVAGALAVGPPTSSTRTSTEVVTAQRGVVQSTVTGSGNIEPSVDVTASFATSGTLSNIDVHVGQHVHAGQLLATLDPTSAQLSVDQAQESLTAARDGLSSALTGQSTAAGSGATSTGATAGSSGSGATTATRAVLRSRASTEFVSAISHAGTQTTSTAPTHPSAPTTPTRTGPTSTTPTRTTPTRTTPTPTRTTTTTTSTAAAPTTTKASTATTAAQSSTTTTPSPAAIASARAAVDGAQASLRSAETALAQTRLVAPVSGTIVSLQSVNPGDAVTGGSASSGASSSSSGSASSATGGSASTGTTAAGSLGSSSSSTTSSGFAEIVNTGHETMTVALSESDISKVHVGQPASVTLDALSGVELAAHVASISTVGTSSSGVVSYNALLDIDDANAEVKAGMSASASIVARQASGITLPNSAVTGSGAVSSVNVLRDGHTVSTPVVVGLQGDSRTQIVSGLSAGDQVVVRTALPALGTASSASTGSTGTLGATGRSRLGSGLGAAGFGGGGLPGGGGFAPPGGAG